LPVYQLAQMCSASNPAEAAMDVWHGDKCSSGQTCCWRAPPGVLEQVLDCSGGDDISEESGRQRKLDALLALLRSQVTLAFRL
jgi:hypothetical protein